MALPADMTIYADASTRGTFSVYGAPPVPCGKVDTLTSGLVQGTPGSRPSWDDYIMCGGPSFIFGGSGAPLYSEPTYFAFPSFVFVLPFSITCFMQGDGVATVAELSPNIAAGQGVMLGTDTAALTIRGPGGTATVTMAAGWNSSNVGQVITIDCDGTKAGIAVYANNVAQSISVSGADPGTGSAVVAGGFVGQDHAGATPLTGDIGFLGVIWGRVSTAADRTSTQAFLTRNGAVANASSWYLPTAGLPASCNLIGVGDSQAFGHLTQSLSDVPPSLNLPYAYLNRAASMLGSRAQGGTSQNFALSSAQLTTFVLVNPCTTQWSTNGVPAIVSGMTNVASLEGGVNDTLGINPTSYGAMQSCASTLVSRWSTLLSLVVGNLHGVTPGALGHHIVVWNSIIPGFATSAATGNYYQAARWQANLTIRSQLQTFARSDVVIVENPLGLDPVLSIGQASGITPNPAYKAAGDGVHYAKPGHRRAGGRLGKLLLSQGA